MIASLIETFGNLKTARFKDEEFNLDLTYVTERIIAMSFPGSNIELLYRNSISDVAKLLEKRHGNKYLVYNLSGQAYDYKKFNYNVREYPWEDHHSPPIHLIFEACQSIHDYLKSDPQNVVSVHCHAGKGRTGTIIVCYLLYCGRFSTSENALEYYKRKRFRKDGGVTQPSQIRAVKYFERVLNSYLSLNKVIDPVVAQAESITIHGVPDFSSGTFRPAFKIYAVREKKLLYNSVTFAKPAEYQARDLSKIQFYFGPMSPILSGDVVVKVYHENMFGGLKKAFRFAFNTSFLDVDEQGRALIRLPLENIDPHELKKDKRFPLSFAVDLTLKVLVKDLRSDDLKSQTMNHDPKLKICMEKYQEDMASWNIVYGILDRYKVPSKEESITLLFRDPANDDVTEVLSKKKPENWEVVEYDDDNNPHKDKLEIKEINIDDDHVHVSKPV